MIEMTVGEAAEHFGISVDAVRRRIRRGELRSKQDDRGRYIVIVDTDGASPVPEEGPPTDAAEMARLRMQLEHERELLAEVRRQRDELAVLLDSQRSQIEASYEAQQRDAEERSELRRLLGNAQMQISSLLPAPRQVGDEREERPGHGEQDSSASESRSHRWRWPWSRED